jgi:glycosyltransferase involved in cell wall biosynthesis
VSVLLPAYNAAPYLAAACRSLQKQTFKDFEVLILNDGSTDQTADIARGFTARDRRFRLIDSPQNQGLTATLNSGLHAARGQLVARQDADDLSASSRLAAQVSLFRAHPALLLAGTGGWETTLSGFPVARILPPATPAAIRWALLLDNPFLHTSVMFRRERVIAEFGGYDPTFRISQDYALWSTMARAGAELRNLTASLVSVRLQPASLSRGNPSLTDSETFSVLRENAAAFAPRVALSAADLAMLARFRSQLLPSDAPRFQQIMDALFEDHVAIFRPDSDASTIHSRFLFRAGYNLLTASPQNGMQLLKRAAEIAPKSLRHWPWAKLATLTLFGPGIRRWLLDRTA